MADAAVDTGSVIRGYRLGRRLGAGGMGTVYVAEKLATHQTFALKLMQGRLVVDPRYVARFEREIGALHAIRHPNVVDVFEWSLPEPGSSDPPFLVMELLEGEVLERLLRRMPILPPGVAVALGLQVLDGLSAAHAVGVIHRDLGPSNVFLEPQPGGKFRVKILDFGLARPIGQGEGATGITREGALIGKPAYAAPELFHRRQLDARADLYACGILLYRMLTGRFPYWESATEALWLERYAERDWVGEYSSPKRFRKTLPDSLDAVVVRAIRRNPDERYASAREMQQALLGIEDEVLQDQETVPLQRASRPGGEFVDSSPGVRVSVSAIPPPAQRPWLPAAFAATTLVTVALLALLIIFGRC